MKNSSAKKEVGLMRRILCENRSPIDENTCRPSTVRKLKLD